MRRLTLRGWAALDDLRRSIEKRAEEGNWYAVPELIHQTIELCTPSDREEFWLDTVQLYNQVLEANVTIKKFPVLSTKEKAKKLPWEYEGRSWYFWLNLFAGHYGWNAGQVGRMDIDAAIGLYQEILLDEQMSQEWQWGLSEMAYPYNKSTKTSRFSPLPRPDWMKGVAGPPKPVKTEKMPAVMLPMGLVINLDEN